MSIKEQVLKRGNLSPLPQLEKEFEKWYESKDSFEFKEYVSWIRKSFKIGERKTKEQMEVKIKKLEEFITEERLRRKGDMKSVLGVGGSMQGEIDDLKEKLKKQKEQILKEIDELQKFRVCDDCLATYEVNEKGECLSCGSTKFEFAIFKEQLKKRLKKEHP